MIREASEQDVEAIVDIYNYYIRNTVVTFEETEVDVRDFSARIRKVQGSGNSWLVAIEEGRVIGYAYSTKWNERAAYRSTVEVSVYLSHTEVSKGWGTRLYDELFSGLLVRGIHVVIGGITLPNAASVALHEKKGMEKVAHFVEVGNKFGEWLDVGYWQVRLST